MVGLIPRGVSCYRFSSTENGSEPPFEMQYQFGHADSLKYNYRLNQQVRVSDSTFFPFRRTLAAQAKGLPIHDGRGKEAGSVSYTPAALSSMGQTGINRTTREVLGSSDPGSRGANDLG